MNVPSGKERQRRPGDDPGGSSSFAGLPEAWGLAGLLALAPVIGALLGLLADRLTGIGPLSLVVGTAGGVVLAASGFVQTLRSWGSRGGGK